MAMLYVLYSVRSNMVQYATVLQRLFSQTLSAWTPAAEASLGQQRAFRYLCHISFVPLCNYLEGKKAFICNIHLQQIGAPLQ